MIELFSTLNVLMGANFLKGLTFLNNDIFYLKYSCTKFQNHTNITSVPVSLTQGFQGPSISTSKVPTQIFVAQFLLCCLWNFIALLLCIFKFHIWERSFCFYSFSSDWLCLLSIQSSNSMYDAANWIILLFCILLILFH